ncbi:MAG TPA: hypothetical protein PKA00_01040 [Saprospiraceae bacterium]|nr:hypothetical protein [Saprospiraceae bacterium]HMQ81452.1 hypothetical protein [Saprospiraceae bacterium]
MGTDFTQNLKGKKVAFFADPQIWWKVLKKWSAGSRINCFYQVLSDNESIQVYPTLGIRYDF